MRVLASHMYNARGAIPYCRNRVVDRHTKRELDV